MDNKRAVLPLVTINHSQIVSISANRILVSAISLSASASATLDIGYIGSSQILAKIHGYGPKYLHISAKIPVIG